MNQDAQSMAPGPWALSGVPPGGPPLGGGVHTWSRPSAREGQGASSGGTPGREGFLEEAALTWRWGLRSGWMGTCRRKEFRERHSPGGGGVPACGGQYGVRVGGRLHMEGGGSGGATELPWAPWPHPVSRGRGRGGPGPTVLVSALFRLQPLRTLPGGVRAQWTLLLRGASTLQRGGRADVEDTVGE